MPRPTDLDDLDAPDIGKSMEQMGQILSEESQVPSGDDEDEEEIEVGREPEVDDEGDDEPPMSRRDKRRRRGEEWRNNIKGQLAETQKQLEETLRQSAETQRQLAEIRGIASMYPNPHELQQRLLGQQAPDPFAAELESLETAGTAIRDAYYAKQQAGTLTPEETRDFQARAKKIESRTKELEFQRNMKRHGGQQQGQPLDADQLAQAAMQRMVRAENADVYGNEAAHNLAKSLWAQEATKVGGEQNIPNGKILHDRVMAMTRQQLGMPDPRGGPSAPSEATRRRLSGSPRGARGPGGTTGKTIRMTKEMKRMADITLGHIKDPRARYQHWANTAGKGMLEDE